MNMLTTILFPYEGEYFVILDIEFAVHEEKVEIIDMEVVEVVGESDEFRAQIANDVLCQFNPIDYQDHFIQAAFEWENR